MVTAEIDPRIAEREEEAALNRWAPENLREIARAFGRIGSGLVLENRLNQSQGGNYILERWQRHGRCKHQCVGSGL